MFSHKVVELRAALVLNKRVKQLVDLAVHSRWNQLLDFLGDSNRVSRVVLQRLLDLSTGESGGTLRVESIHGQ